MLRAFLGAFLVGLLSAFALNAEARPPAPLQLSQNLNGEPVRPTQSDGGALLLSSTGVAVATATVACGGVYKLVCPSTAVNFCAWSTDGGCSADVANINYGDPIAAASFGYFVAQDCSSGTKTVSAVSQTDAGVSCPLFRMY